MDFTDQVVQIFCELNYWAVCYCLARFQLNQLITWKLARNAITQCTCIYCNNLALYSLYTVCLQWISLLLLFHYFTSSLTPCRSAGLTVTVNNLITLDGSKSDQWQIKVASGESESVPIVCTKQPFKSHYGLLTTFQVILTCQQVTVEFA